MSDLVLYQPLPPAVLLTLNRPDKRNALNRALVAALEAALRQARDQADSRCVLLTGAGPAFCAGMDLGELAQILEQPAEQSQTWEDVHQLANLYDLIYHFPKPTLALVNGPALAGGAGLVSVCDLALAVPEARFGYPEVRRGLVAALVLPHLLRHVGERLARYLLLTGELIDAAEACRWGLINAVVPASDLLSTGCAWARSLAQGGPHALARTKELLRQCSRQALSIEQLVQASAAPRLTEECRQGLRAFFARQPPPWAPPSS
jgi:methylglutaconyl-CoA hydratase